MTKNVIVQVEGEDCLRKIQVTDVKEEDGKLILLDGGKKVVELPQRKVEHWSFEE
jgi:hypothetical protein